MDALLQGNAQDVSEATAKIPGYGLIAQIALKLFGIDVGNIVSIYLVVFGVYRSALWFYQQIQDYYIGKTTSTIMLSDDYPIYDHFMRWAIAQQRHELSCYLKTTPKKPLSRSGADDDDDDDDDESEVLTEDGIFDYKKWSSKIPIYYIENSDLDGITYNGRYFRFEYLAKERKNGRGDQWDYFIYIHCAGRSTQPIKDLITHIRAWSRRPRRNMTEIYRTDTSKGGIHWACQATRPSRPLSTISLDHEQKCQIVNDINEYLSPSTARWYATRGIPHRRGYLFYGPPGTGKTSLSFGLAGIFGVGIYCVSLNSSELTETNLATLFIQLPRRCLVLLEDIDSAGIGREHEWEEPQIHKSSENEPNEPNDLVPLEKPTEVAHVSEGHNSARPGKPETTGKSKISLSGFLNIIDGAASHEGRILIMTTNDPEKLDPAIIRPGRVDLQIKFTLATHEQIRTIFTRMYSADEGRKRKRKQAQKQEHEQMTEEKDTQEKREENPHNLRPSTPAVLELSPEKLEELANQFANEFPEMMFSPAEIQGYLLLKKKDPVGAVAGAQEWREKMLKAKKIGKKMID